jgi:hypothetical protein
MSLNFLVLEFFVTYLFSKKDTTYGRRTKGTAELVTSAARNTC